MGCSSLPPNPKLCNYIFINLSLFFGFIFAQISSNNHFNYSSLVFTHCSNHTTTLDNLTEKLFRELVAESSKSTFFHTYVGDDSAAVSGRFQCRGDVSNEDCHVCVNKLPAFSAAFCGNTVPARVQLGGCYLHYRAEPDTPDSVSGSAGPYRLLHRKCGRKRAELNGFEDSRDRLLDELESCVVKSCEKNEGLTGARFAFGTPEKEGEGKYGFCKVSYDESLHGVAQCDGSLGACECGSCIGAAARMAQDECSYSASAEIYLDECFLSYKYDKDHKDEDDDDDDGDDDDNDDSGNNDKLVAIVVGSIVAVIIIAGILGMSRRNKSDDGRSSCKTSPSTSPSTCPTLSPKAELWIGPNFSLSITNSVLQNQRSIRSTNDCWW